MLFMERFLGEGPRERNGGRGAERRWEERENEQAHRHTQLSPALSAVAAPSRPESEESILAIQTIAPADDSTPHHHLTAST